MKCLARTSLRIKRQTRRIYSRKILMITPSIRTSKISIFHQFIFSQTINYEELLQNLKEQLDKFDFLAEHERAQEENE